MMLQVVPEWEAGSRGDGVEDEGGGGGDGGGSGATDSDEWHQSDPLHRQDSPQG